MASIEAWLRDVESSNSQLADLSHDDDSQLSSSEGEPELWLSPNRHKLLDCDAKVVDARDWEVLSVGRLAGQHTQQLTKNNGEFENFEAWIDDDTLLDSGFWGSESEFDNLGMRGSVKFCKNHQNECCRQFENEWQHMKAAGSTCSSNYSDYREIPGTKFCTSGSLTFPTAGEDDVDLGFDVNDLMSDGGSELDLGCFDLNVDMQPIVSNEESFTGEVGCEALKLVENNDEGWSNDIPVEIPTPICLRRSFHVSQGALETMQEKYGGCFVMMKERWTERGLGTGVWEAQVRGLVSAKNSTMRSCTNAKPAGSLLGSMLEMDQNGNFVGLEQSPAVHYARLVYVINGMCVEIKISDFGYTEATMEAFCLDAQRAGLVLEGMDRFAAELGFTALHAYEPLEFL